MNKYVLFLLSSLFLVVSVFLNPIQVKAGSASSLLDDINRSTVFTSSDNLFEDFIGNLLPLSLTFGGFILVIMLVMGGYTMMTSVGNPQAQEAGKEKITWAIIGFLILFSAFWIWQLINVIFGISDGGGATAGSNNSGQPSGYDPGEPDESDSVCEDGNCANPDGSCSCSTGTTCYVGNILCCEGTTALTCDYDDDLQLP